MGTRLFVPVLVALLAATPAAINGQDTIPVPPPAQVDTAAMVALVLEAFPVLIDPETTNGPVVEVQKDLTCYGHPECRQHPESTELLFAYAAEHGLRFVDEQLEMVPCTWNREAHPEGRGRRLAVRPPRYHPKYGWSMTITTHCVVREGRGFAFGMAYRFEYTDGEWRMTGRPMMFIT
jgi:hypothetical protein